MSGQAERRHELVLLRVEVAKLPHHAYCPTTASPKFGPPLACRCPVRDVLALIDDRLAWLAPEVKR